MPSFSAASFSRAARTTSSMPPNLGKPLRQGRHHRRREGDHRHRGPGHQRAGERARPAPAPRRRWRSAPAAHLDGHPVPGEQHGRGAVADQVEPLVVGVGRDQLAGLVVLDLGQPQQVLAGLVVQRSGTGRWPPRRRWRRDHPRPLAVRWAWRKRYHGAGSASVSQPRDGAAAFSDRLLAQLGGHVGRDQPGHVPAEGGHLADQPGGHVEVVLAGHDEDRLELGQQLPVHVGQLELVVEVGDRPQAAQHGVDAALAGVLDQQPVEAVHLDARVVLHRLEDEALALGHREERRLLRVVGHRDDQPVEQVQAALDDGDVAVGERVEAAGVDGDAGHGPRSIAHSRT